MWPLGDQAHPCRCRGRRHLSDRIPAHIGRAADRRAPRAERRCVRVRAAASRMALGRCNRCRRAPVSRAGAERRTHRARGRQPAASAAVRTDAQCRCAMARRQPRHHDLSADRRCSRVGRSRDDAQIRSLTSARAHPRSHRSVTSTVRRVTHPVRAATRAVERVPRTVRGAASTVPRVPRTAGRVWPARLLRTRPPTMVARFRGGDSRSARAARGSADARSDTPAGVFASPSRSRASCGDRVGRVESSSERRTRHKA